MGTFCFVESSSTPWFDIVSIVFLGAITVLSGILCLAVGVWALLDFGLVGIPIAALSLVVAVACIISGLVLWAIAYDVRS